MKTILQHIESAKEKSPQARKNIAFTTAGLITAFIALVWFTNSISSGAFALKNNAVTGSAEQESSITAESSDNSQNLAGAAATLPDSDVPAHIEIVDTSSSTPQSRRAEQTTIPF